MRPRSLPLVVSLLAAAGSLALTSQARAYCLATTCDPSSESCPLDDDGCKTTGKPVYWASDCISFGVQEDGSKLHDVDFAAFSRIVEAAFATWAAADCGGDKHPSFESANLGPVECATAEYNQSGHNVSLFTFRDEVWPYRGAADSLGRTGLTFDRKTGELFDADVEINGTTIPLQAGGSGDGADLESIVLHEVGHFLGLDHSLEAGSVMEAGYTGDELRRELSSDDTAGICAVFPPDRAIASTSCEPRHGFSAQCLTDQPPPAPMEPSENRNEGGGCSIGSPRRASAGNFSAFAFVALGTWIALRRRRRQ